MSVGHFSTSLQHFVSVSDSEFASWMQYWSSHFLVTVKGLIDMLTRASDLSSLSLSFVVCIMGIMMPISQSFYINQTSISLSSSNLCLFLPLSAIIPCNSLLNLWAVLYMCIIWSQGKRLFSKPSEAIVTPTVCGPLSKSDWSRPKSMCQALF